MEPYRAALNLEGRMLPTPWAQCPLTSGVTAPALFCCLGNILHLQHAQCSAPVGNAPKQTPPFPFPGPHIPCSWAAQGSGSAPQNQHRATYRHMGRGEEFGQWEFWVMWCGSHVADSNISTPPRNSFCSKHYRLLRYKEEKRTKGRAVCLTLCVHHFSELTLWVTAQKVWIDPLHWTPPKSPLVMQVWYGSKHLGKEK